MTSAETGPLLTRPNLRTSGNANAGSRPRAVLTGSTLLSPRRTASALAPLGRAPHRESTRIVRCQCLLPPTMGRSTRIMALPPRPNRISAQRHTNVRKNAHIRDPVHDLRSARSKTSHTRNDRPGPVPSLCMSHLVRCNVNFSSQRKLRLQQRALLQEQRWTQSL